MDARERQNWVNVLRIVSQSECEKPVVPVKSTVIDNETSKTSIQTHKLTNIELIKEVNNHVKINFQKLENILNVRNLKKKKSFSKFDASKEFFFTHF